MSAPPIMVVVLKRALTLLDHSPVTVTLGTHLIMMASPVMVRVVSRDFGINHANCTVMNFL